MLNLCKSSASLSKIAYIRSQNIVESNSTSECERIHTSEGFTRCVLLAHVN